MQRTSSSSSSLRFCLPAGNSCPYISDDLNEDTISVLVRLITEKKGRRGGATMIQAPKRLKL